MGLACDLREGPSTERAFEAEQLPAWTEQITVRSLVVSLVLGTSLSAVIMNMSFTSGMMPSLNVSAGLLGLFLLKTWTRLLGRFGVFHKTFTRQENTIVQTCIVACASMASSGGFGTFMLGMGQKAADGNSTGHDEKNISEPKLGRLIAFYFLISFVGLFAIVPMTKTMIIRHRLTYPTGMATAHLINGFHTPDGAQQAKKQVSLLLKSFGGSMFWALFQWFYTAGMNCGFVSFPTFGLQAYRHGFYFGFSATYVGVGMICPYLISISMLIGSIIASGIIGPYLQTKKGDWYIASEPLSSMRSIGGYKVFMCIAMILGDGLFQILAILLRTMYTMYSNRRQAAVAPTPFSNANAGQHPALSFDDRRRSQIFLKDQIPSSFAVGGYILLATISTIAVPHLYSQLKYYHIAVAYIVAPLLAFCNAYSTGITDMNLSGHYSKIAILIFAKWVGVKDGGVVAGLAACAILMAIVSTASDFMQDFKTGYLTLTSPRSVFISQVIGTGLGCIINPSVFWMFYNFYKKSSNEMYQAPYAKVFRAIAILGAGGFQNLPKHCIDLSVPFFVLALSISALREVSMHKNWRIQHYIPSAVGMAVSFLILPSISISMCIGSLILFVWNKTDKESAQSFSPVVASGLICGDGIFSLPLSLLGIKGVTPPICMKFLSRDANAKVDVFLQSLPPPHS